MRLSDQATIGDVFQLFDMAVLEKVSKAFPGSEAEANGYAAAKLLIPASMGWDYVYINLEDNGTLVISYQKELAPGQPRVILGPFKPEQYIKFSVTFLAVKILAAVKKLRG
jgi:hypothetical protein